MKKAHLLILLISVLLVNFSSVALADEVNIEDKLSDLKEEQRRIEKEIERLEKSIDDKIKFEKEKFDYARDDFKGLTTDLKDITKGYIEHVENAHNKFIWIVVIVSGVIFYFVGSELDSFKENLRESYETKAQKEAKEIRNKYEGTIESEIKEQINESQDQFKRKLLFLQKEMEKEQSYRYKRILFLVEDRELSEVDKEMKILKKNFGDSNVEVTNDLKIEKNQFDLIIFYIKDVKEKEKLEKMLERFKCNLNSIPIVVYTYNSNGRFVSSNILEKYKWYTFANMPVTLISNVYTILNVFGDSEY